MDKDADDEECGRSDARDRNDALELYSEEESSTLSSSDEELPDYTLLLPPASQAPKVGTVDYYLNRASPPILVLLMDRDDAVSMFKACKREGHKASLEFVSNGQAVVKYAKKPKTWREIGGHVRVSVISTTERRVSIVAASIRRSIRSLVILLRNPWFWVIVLAVGLFGTCVVSLSLCLAFNICVDIVSTPRRILVEFLLLVLGCALYLGGGVFYACQLIGRGLSLFASFVVENAALLDRQARHAAQTLIRSTVAFLEAFIQEEL